MSWRTAFTHLAAIPVAGVQTSYDVDDLPNTLPAADLPALVPAFPPVGGADEDDPDLAVLTYDGSAWTAALHVEHLLVWCPTWSEMGLRSALPALIEAVDSYLAAVSADGTLGGALAAPLEVVRVQVGVIAWGGVTYYGARFRHRWVRTVG